MQPYELERRFAFSPTIPGPAQTAHDNARVLTLRYARDICALLAEGREESLFVTNLEQALFWAEAAIARETDRAAREGRP